MTLHALWLAAVLAQAPASPADPFGPLYPIDAEASYAAGLFHWVDSLAQTSVGKTIPAHRAEFTRRFGRPNPSDLAAIDRFRRARLAHAEKVGSLSAMLGTFCAAPSLERALEAAGEPLGVEGRADLAESLAHFRGKFDEVWAAGTVPRRFLASMVEDPGSARLGDLLGRAARFFGANGAELTPRPRLVLVPVPDGWGTHAQAIGRNLLLEIRPNDRLADQASVVVHENVHFLWDAMPAHRNAGLAEVARRAAPHGAEAWDALREALPTALGQGVADRAFRPLAWSRRSAWYHVDSVDAYAKALYPLVQQAIDLGSYFDEEFVRLAVRLYPRKAVTLRSP